LLWFNFIKSPKRYISPQKAENIKTPFFVLRVGLFGIQNENKTWKSLTKDDLKNVVLLAKQTKMNAIQIHWNCDFFYLKLHNFITIHSININSKQDFNNPYVDFYIIDGAEPWSWKWYNYEKINKLNLKKKFLVAGWVNKDNVWKIFEIFKNNPYFMGVDVASWVDNGKNIDLEKINKIISLIY